MNDFFNTVSTFDACNNGCVQKIHSTSARDASSLPKPTANTATSTVPSRASLGTLFAGRLLLIINLQHGKARPSETNHHHNNSQDSQAKITSRNNGPTVSPLPSAATGLTLQTLSKPFPSISQSINPSINRSYTHACPANQYAKQFCSLEGTPSAPPTLIYTKIYLSLSPIAR
jgi:hypothetical protein